MSKDYLWDRSGSDPEIERLENVLAVLRYQESDAPAAPHAVVIQPNPVWTRLFSIRLIFGAAAAAVLVCIVWLSSVPLATPPQLSTLQVADPLQKSLSEVNQDSERAVKDEHFDDLPASVPRRIVARARVPRHSYATRQKILVSQRRRVDNVERVSLTNEEKDAYGKLMLALLITGSKLKLVQDTIDRIEDTDSSDKQR